MPFFHKATGINATNNDEETFLIANSIELASVRDVLTTLLPPPPQATVINAVNVNIKM
jgi:hypothetical protein